MGKNSERYRKQNPEQEEKRKIQAEIKHLEKAGYVVIKPRENVVQIEELPLEKLEAIEEERKAKNRAYLKKWRAENRERINLYQREYKKAKRQRIKNAIAKAKAEQQEGGSMNE